jgi:2-polyprenyl-3-methyl-5-hydroxy-6-metoxy-1,4-benzoquinol methylase
LSVVRTGGFLNVGTVGESKVKIRGVAGAAVNSGHPRFFARPRLRQGEFEMVHPTHVPHASSTARDPSVAVEMESVDCPHCGGRTHESILAARDHLTGRGGEFQIVRCTHCELAFTNPRPTQASIGLFYPRSYGPFEGHEIGKRARQTWKRRLESAVLQRYFDHPAPPRGRAPALAGVLGKAVIRNSRQRLSWIPFRAPGRMLDFGCGAGDFMKRMRDHGWTVEGIDVSPEIARQVRESSGVPVHVGSLPHPDIGPESFDAIVMWDSLEHVHRPRRVLEGARESLRAGGLVVIGVPNFGSWSRQHSRDNWYGLELPRHLTHFTARTLAAMVEAEGFRVVSNSQVEHGSTVSKSARRAVENGSRSVWTHSLRWSAVSRPVATFARRIGRGESLRLIAEKLWGN